MGFLKNLFGSSMSDTATHTVSGIRLWERPRYRINTVSTKGSRGLGTGSDCPIVCPAVSVFVDPSLRVAL